MINFDCPNCGKPIAVPDKAAGRAGVCPKCHGRMVVPGAAQAPAPATGAAPSPAPGGAKPGADLQLMPEDDAPAPAAPATPRPQAPAPEPAPETPAPAAAATSADAAAPARKPCPFCGEMIAATAKKCRFCGESLVAAPPAPKNIACPFCAEAIPAGSRRCPCCGETLGVAARPASTGNTGRRAAVKGDTGRHRAVKGNTNRHKAVAQPPRPASSKVNVGGIVALLLALSIVGVIIKACASSPANQLARQVRELRDKAEKGDAEAQCQLAVRYYNGEDGIEKNQQEAVRWYRKAAEQGHMGAQNYLGVCYSDGEGVKANAAEAVRWYRKAAAQGSREARYNLAMHYLAGTGVRKDVAEARRLLRQASDQGYHLARAALRDLGPDDDEDDDDEEPTTAKAKEPPRPKPTAPPPPTVAPPAPAPRTVAGLAFAANYATVELPGGVKLEMARVKAGTFMMGSPADEDWRDDDERRHSVTLTRDYWLGKYEVTQGQWKAVMGNNPSYAKKGDDYPVEQVSWRDAMAFCEKLNERFRDGLPRGYRFNLPTEAQWEYAARGGDVGRRYVYSGNDDADIVAWCYENSGDKRLDIADWKDPGTAARRAALAECGTHPVGKKLANELGLCDMSGNVAEWCRDRFGAYSVGAARDPAGPITGEARVIRGGYWGMPSFMCRVAYRDNCAPDERGNHMLGFRLALVAIE